MDYGHKLEALRRDIIGGRRIVVADGLATMGDWIYKRFDHSPEIWRYPGGHGETRAIIWASLFPFFTCAVFALLCIHLHLFSYSATIGLALAIWLMGPLPLTITNALFIKLTFAVATAHSLGWLVKLCLAAIAVVVILG